ncbi:MAG TPA: STAS domain-containing protein [Clostridiales bacterium]|nr:STAS domain-containing protein [Clostridiales bacterium]
MSLEVYTQYNQEKNEWEVHVEGEIDIYTAGKLKEALNRILDEKNVNLRVDLKELNYIDSTGLGVFIGILRRLKENGNDLIMINTKSNIRKLLKITGLDKIFMIEGE